MNPLDPIFGARVDCEKPSARARGLFRPGQGVAHNLFAVVARALEDFNLAGGNREMLLITRAGYALPKAPYATSASPAAAISQRARDEAAS